MGRHAHSEEDMFGDFTHYDENGRKIGTSRQDAFGNFTNYDKNGRKTGTSRRNVFGGFTHYDAKGRRIGRSDQDAYGYFTNYDANGKKTSTSRPQTFGGFEHTSAPSQGCYIATCVYGSYSCPEVCVLRRYRDAVLKKSRAGRGFIRLYYRISPELVKRFKNCEWFKKAGRALLSRHVNRLIEKGFSPSPYSDTEA